MDRHKDALKRAAFLVLVSVFLGSLYHALASPLPLFVAPLDPAAQELPGMTTEQVKVRLGRQGVYLLDARPLEAFQRGHLPRSVSVPLHSNLDPDLLSDLREAKLVVTYCDSPKCDASKQLALRLKAKGVANLAVYHEGLEEWRAQGLAVLSNEDALK